MTAPDPQAIRAALDAAEHTAKAAAPPPWDWVEYDAFGGRAGDVLMPFGDGSTARTGLTRSSLVGTQDAATAQFIAAWDPAAVLRHIDAARQILKRAVETLNEHWQIRGALRPDRCARCDQEWPCPDRRRALATLTALAAAWQPAQQED